MIYILFSKGRQLELFVNCFRPEGGSGHTATNQLPLFWGTACTSGGNNSDGPVPSRSLGLKGAAYLSDDGFWR